MQRSNEEQRDLDYVLTGFGIPISICAHLAAKNIGDGVAVVKADYLDPKTMTVVYQTLGWIRSRKHNPEYYKVIEEAIKRAEASNQQLVFVELEGFNIRGVQKTTADVNQEAIEKFAGCIEETHLDPEGEEVQYEINFDKYNQVLLDEGMPLDIYRHHKRMLNNLFETYCDPAIRGQYKTEQILEEHKPSFEQLGIYGHKMIGRGVIYLDITRKTRLPDAYFFGESFPQQPFVASDRVKEIISSYDMANEVPVVVNVDDDHLGVLMFALPDSSELQINHDEPTEDMIKQVVRNAAEGLPCIGVGKDQHGNLFLKIDNPVDNYKDYMAATVSSNLITRS